MDRLLPFALAALCLGSAPRPAQAQELPLKKIPPAQRAELLRVWRQPTVRCEAAPRGVYARSQDYRTLLQQLPLASRWLKALGLGSYAIVDAPQGRFRIDDEAGARAICERVVDQPGLLVIVARGWLEVPVLPKIEGTGVIVIRYPEGKFPPRGAPRGTKARVKALRCSAQVAFRVKSRLLHALGRTFRRTLRGVLVAKLEKLIGSATALAERVSGDPFALHDRLRKATLPPKPPARKPLLTKADLAAYRKLFLRGPL